MEYWNFSFFMHSDYITKPMIVYFQHILKHMQTIYAKSMLIVRFTHSIIVSRPSYNVQHPAGEPSMHTQW